MERRRGEYLQTYVTIHAIGLAALALCFSREQRYEALGRANYKCETCGEDLKPGQRKVHHKKPIHSGGEDTLDNAQALCLPCERAAHEELYILYGNHLDWAASLPPKEKDSPKAGKNKRK